jgi:anti-sigma factor RsiW
MNCPGFEERIARYVGGDLEVREAAALQQHLRECGRCAQLASEMEEDRRWLGSRPPEMRDVDFAAMRSQIRREIERPRSRWRWLPAVVAAAAMVVFFVVANERHVPPRPRVAQAPAVVAAAPVTVAAKAAPPVRHRKTKTAVAPQAGLSLEEAMRMLEELEPAPATPAPAVAESPVEVRIATSDPSVTIILVQESKGDSQ